MGVPRWSLAASDNGTVDPALPVADGLSGRAVAAAIRSLMAAVRALTDDQGGALVTAGQANAYTVKTRSGLDTMRAGLSLVVQADRDSLNSDVTLAVDGFGPYAWTTIEGQRLSVAKGLFYPIVLDVTGPLPVWRAVTASSSIAALQTALAGKLGTTGDAGATTAKAKFAATVYAEVVRPIEAHLGSVIRLRADMGAAGTYTSDDSPAIQKAINAQIRSGGVPIFVEPGLYLMQAGVSNLVDGTQQWPVTIEGPPSDGSGPQTFNNGNTAVFLDRFGNLPTMFRFVSSHPCIVRNVRLDVEPSVRGTESGVGFQVEGYGGATNGGSVFERVCSVYKDIAIDFLRPSYPVVRDCYLYNYKTAGIRYRTSHGVESSAGTIGGSQILSLRSGADAGVLLGCGYAKLIGVGIGQGNYGLKLQLTDTSAGSIIVTGCNIEDQGVAGILLDSTDASPASMVQIVNNTFSVGAAGLIGNPFTAHVLASGGAWLESLDLSHNAFRSRLGANTRMIYLQGGLNLNVKHNTLTYLPGSASSVGIQAVGTAGSVENNTFQLLSDATLAQKYATQNMQIRHGYRNAAMTVSEANAAISGNGDGSEIYVTDGTYGSNPIATGGSGAIMRRIGGVWRG